MYQITLDLSSTVECPSLKGNQAPHLKFEWPNGKTQNPNFFEIGQELVPQAHLKAEWSNFFEDLNGIKTNQNKWKSKTFLIVLHLKPQISHLTENRELLSQLFGHLNLI